MRSAYGVDATAVFSAIADDRAVVDHQRAFGKQTAAAFRSGHGSRRARRPTVVVTAVVSITAATARTLIDHDIPADAAVAHTQVAEGKHSAAATRRSTADGNDALAHGHIVQHQIPERADAAAAEVLASTCHVQVSGSYFQVVDLKRARTVVREDIVYS